MSSHNCPFIPQERTNEAEIRVRRMLGCPDEILNNKLKKDPVLNAMFNLLIKQEEHILMSEPYCPKGFYCPEYHRRRIMGY